MRPLDAIDQRLLRELRENARLPLARLSALVHLSRNAVRQRMDRLERDGHIRGYTIVEREPEQESTLTAYLLIDRFDRLRGSEVIALLQEIPEVVLCHVVAGDFDLIARVEAPSPQRMQAVWQEIAQHPGVRDTTTALALSTAIGRIKA